MYQNKVNCSLAPTQRPSHDARNCKLDYHAMVISKRSIVSLVFLLKFTTKTPLYKRRNILNSWTFVNKTCLLTSAGSPWALVTIFADAFWSSNQVTTRCVRVTNISCASTVSCNEQSNDNRIKSFLFTGQEVNSFLPSESSHWPRKFQ